MSLGVPWNRHPRATETSTPGGRRQAADNRSATSTHLAHLQIDPLHAASFHNDSLRFTSLYFTSLRFTSLLFTSLRFTPLTVNSPSLHFIPRDNTSPKPRYTSRNHAPNPLFFSLSCHFTTIIHSTCPPHFTSSRMTCVQFTPPYFTSLSPHNTSLLSTSCHFHFTSIHATSQHFTLASLYFTQQHSIPPLRFTSGHFASTFTTTAHPKYPHITSRQPV